jgi:aryl-alcohol dehydrogenase-like predicted oxidoreductase
MTIDVRVPFGSTGVSISRVGLGTWAIGGGDWLFGWGPQDDEVSIAAVQHAVATGINWIDTAAVYGLGRSEQVVGRAVAALPEADRPYLFTKCGRVWNGAGTVPRTVLAPDSIRRECEASLRRLGVERIDLYQIHWPARDAPIEDAWGAMAELADEGKVRWIGVSNFDVPLLEACERIRHVDSLQPPLSLIQRYALGKILPWCGAHRTGVIVYSPLQSGLLTGRMTRERVDALDGEDWRRRSEQFQEPRLSRNLELVELLRPVAARRDCALAELAIAWALAQPGVTGAIVGGRSPAQVDEWAGAARLELTAEDLADLAAAVERSGVDASPPVPPS